MHERCLGLGGKYRTRRWVGKRVGGDGRFDLFDRRLDDVGEGFQLGQCPAEENTFSHSNTTACTCETYPLVGSSVLTRSDIVN